MPTRAPTHKPFIRVAAVHNPQVAESDDWREWYTHSKWRRIAREHRAKHPLCVFCQREGKVVEGKIVDHVVPHRGDKAAFFAGPFQTLCKVHHDSTKKKQEYRQSKAKTTTPAYVIA